jgi:peptide/nickel transport system permease protein
MLRYVVRRLLLLVPILLGVSVLIFFWVHALPGNPASALLGERATPELVKQYKERYGLDRPLPVQYWDYIKVTAQGDLGTSITTRRSVVSEIKRRFPATIELAIAAMIFAVGVGLLPSVGRQDILLNPEHPTGFYVLDGLITRDWTAMWDAIKHLILPAIALGSIPLAITMRITRASTLDVQNEDYVRTARAKGLAPHTVDRRHVLRNALLPVATIIGLQTGLLLSGAVLTETVFAFPGMGSWLRDAIFNSDYPALQGGILFLAVVFVLVNLLVDISYAIINPRIRYS